GGDSDSDSDWSVDGEGGSGLAVVADDTRPDPQVFATPRLGERLAAHSTMLLGVFALGCLVSLGLRSAPAALRARLALGLWPALAGFWVALFVRRALALPAYMGFDGPQHLEYVRFVIEQGALPLASDGGMMYHPPLFYVLSAGLVQLFGSGGDVAALRIASTLPGLAQIAIAFGLARRLFPDDRALARVAAVCAGLLPMNLYMSCYLSNEPLHAALAGLAIWATVGLLLRDGLPWPGLVAVGALLAGAILSKATSLLLLPLVLGFLAWKSDFADRSPAPRSALALAGLVAVVGGLAGWYFVRNQLVFGQAVVGNWNVPGIERVWWQYPGFHTASYYLRFGDVLARPFLVGFSSFFDGIYSTFWGDGLIGGIAAWRDRHPLWNYDAMSLVYVLAVPATAIGIYGFASLVREALSGDDVRRRIALTFIAAVPFATGFVVLYLTLVHPAFGMTKAFYALSVTGCLAVSAARGALLLRRRLAASRWPGLVVPLDAWAVTLIAFIGASFLG
ncbi:MAG: glycosyltransferase family 39 protein, partial [Proteobacteria bacterium]|nr:glycosyltransferase family 39 protein [Pseudomonadota bacterium]